MTLSFIRGFFIVISGVVGYYIGLILMAPQLGWMIGCLSALILILIEMQLRRVSVRGLSSMVFGLLLGIVMAKLLSDILKLLPLNPIVDATQEVVLTVIFSYLGAVMALRGRDEFNLIIPYVRFKRQDIDVGVVLLDTSAIIDGRIKEIYKTNFISGSLVVPRFILQELQRLADSSDDNKRERGRRGLEILRLMQNDPKLDIHIHEDDLNENQDVDSKLIALAKLMDAKICTTDFNLSKVAGLQSIPVLNINELIAAAYAVVTTGDVIKINLGKEGKEPNQAVGYLPDGTMVVVSDAKEKIGRDVTVTVTSILQTSAGRMVFAKLHE